MDNDANSIHQFFLDNAPDKQAFEGAEYVLDVATIVDGVKSITKIIKSKEEGLAIDADGNVFMDLESSHYKAHESMEGFWDSYRDGGEFEETKPTVGEYNSALKDSMVNAGFSEGDADLITEIAANQQRAYGPTEADEVPRILGRINAIER